MAQKTHSTTAKYEIVFHTLMRKLDKTLWPIPHVWNWTKRKCKCVKISNSQFCFLLNLDAVHLLCRMLFQFRTGLLLRCTLPYQDYKMRFEMRVFITLSLWFVCLFNPYIYGIESGSVNNTCAHSAFKQRLLFTPILSSAFGLVLVTFQLNAFCTQFESALFS